MNILIYDENFHNIYGTVKYILPVVELLSKKHDITLLGDSYFDPNDFKMHYGIALKDVNPQYLDYRHSGINLISHWQHIKKCGQISEITENYDVFINNKYENHWEIKPRAKQNIGLIYFPLNPYHRYLQEEPHKFIKNTLRKLLLSSPKKYDFADQYQQTVTVSDFSKKLVQKFWNFKEVSVIYPWIDIMAENKKTEKKNVICSVLRFRSHYSQHLDRMIDSFKILHKSEAKGWSFHIALGIRHSGNEKIIRYIEHLRSLAQGYPVYFHINLSNERLSDLYGMSKIFWQITGYGSHVDKNPEHFEPFGMPTVEAMNNQCVPVALNEGGQKEIVENNISGFLISNLDEFRQATLLLINKPEVLNAFSKNAYIRSMMFSKERFILQFSKILDKLV
ncbi:MAG: glycosyltransferase [Elusimicrobia bacterium]|nr:glycosyltransferase [Candidatus Liberimonas magnetica]